MLDRMHKIKTEVLGCPKYTDRFKHRNYIMIKTIISNSIQSETNRINYNMDNF